MGIMATNIREYRSARWWPGAAAGMKRFHLLLATRRRGGQYGDPDGPPTTGVHRPTSSPYQIIMHRAELSPVLMTTSARDDRVHPGHPFQMTAALT